MRRDFFKKISQYQSLSAFFCQSMCAHTTWCLANAMQSIMQYLGREGITAHVNMMLKESPDVSFLAQSLPLLLVEKGL